MKIPFNIPYSTGKELHYISEAISTGQTAGNGPFTKKCQELLQSKYSFNKTLLTSSCTDALEMTALLMDVNPGDEIIVPSFTFVSTALAFSRQGAKIVFADSRNDNPCIDETKLESLISERTKVIVPVHYAGIACEMDRIMEISEKYHLFVVEDAAHAFGAKYKGKLLGTIGHLGCFSFHETKIIHCGEGGMLSVNDDSYFERAEVIWEKGTNRSSFYRGEVQRYEWLDTGSSFLMSDLSAAFLYSQLEEANHILDRRKRQWQLYYYLLKDVENLGFLKLPQYSNNSEPNFSGFYFSVADSEIAENLRLHLNAKGMQVLSHYLDLSRSPYILKSQPGEPRIQNSNSKMFQDCLLRLPLYFDLSDELIVEVTESIKKFVFKG